MLTNVMVTPEKSSSVPQLPPPFDRLVAEGTLTPEQATRVVAALAEASPPPTPARPTTGLAGRLAEIGAYLGAALVVAAGIVVVAQQWVDMGYGLRIAVMSGTTLVLLGAASALVMFTDGGRWDDVPNGAGLRRLSGALFALAALAAWGTVLTALLSGQEFVSEREASIAFIAAGAAGFAVLVAARLRADTPLGELGMVAASVSIVAGMIQLWFTDRPVAIQWTLLALGLAWALVGTFTQLMRHHTLVTALGLLLALFGAATVAENEWSHRLALLTLVAVALGVYLMRPTWPYITAATLTAVVLTVVWVGDALGPALALLAAGVVVLVLAGGALWLHMRRRAQVLDGAVDSADVQSVEPEGG
jgi:hypothetical protein